MVFAGYSGFLHYLQLASHELATIGMVILPFNLAMTDIVYLIMGGSDDCLSQEQIKGIFEIAGTAVFEIYFRIGKSCLREKGMANQPISFI